MSVLQRLKNDKILGIQTFLLCMIYTIIGYGVALFGPTLLDLQIQVNATLTETARIIPARAIGYAVGSIAAGLIPEKWPHDYIIALCLALTSMCFAIAPWCRATYQLVISVTLSGVFMGTMEVLSNVYTFGLWDKDAAFIIQIVYLFFGVGALAAPLVAGPFLLTEEEEALSKSNNTTVLPPTAQDLQLEYPFEAFAIFTLLTAMSFAITSYKARRTIKNDSEDVGKESFKELRPLSKFCVVALATLVLHLYFGIEVAYGSMLETFLVKGSLGWGKDSAAYVTSVFWTTYTFPRLITIAFLTYLGPFRFLVIEFVLVIVANAVLLTGLAGNTGIWIGSALMGTGSCSVFGLILAYLKEKMKLTSRMMSAFLVAACIGEFIYPLVIAMYIDSQPDIFLYIIGLCSSLMCIVFVALHLFRRSLYKRN